MNVWESFHSDISTFHSTKANIFTSKTSCLLSLQPSCHFFFHLTRILSLEKSALEHSSSCKVMKCSAQGKLGQEINILCFNGHLQHVHTKFLFYLLGYYTEYFFTAHRRMQTNPICYNCSVNLQVASAGRVPVRHTETL